ncbi:MAG: hypothetical protein NWF00_04790 [Candidatus Bathyarchaeota archaeon]|nr:hypothetical protein [Candidatus Bathyarchaeota archaeon]
MQQRGLQGADAALSLEGGLRNNEKGGFAVMLDFLSGVIGAVCVGVPFGLFTIWVASQSYELGWKDRDQGRHIGDKKEED